MMRCKDGGVMTGVIMECYGQIGVTMGLNGDVLGRGV